MESDSLDVHFLESCIYFSLKKIFRVVLLIFYKKKTELLLNFSKPDFLKKISVMKDGILMSRSQIIDGQRF